MAEDGQGADGAPGAGAVAGAATGAPGAQSGAQGAQGPQSGSEWLTDDAARNAKIDQIIERRAAGIIKAALKENGMTDDADIKAVITGYHASKRAQSDTGAKQVAELEARVAALTAERQQQALSAEVARVAAELDADPARIAHLSRLADLSAALKDGEPDKDAIKGALEKVLEDVPEFKKTKTGGIRIGASDDGAGQGASELESMLRAAGLKTKKE
ncbi:MAG: hypothetical protein LBL86_12180 [Coriobacteriales bacterium]|jgi:uncharacterized small protein (DUF1192 family)|nr:hypothetical protein [Coriobacteriales bacterium]